MNSVTFELPPRMWLYVPEDYARSVPNSPICVLRKVHKGGLLVRWDDAELQFVDDQGGCSYRRSAILRFYLGQGRLMRSMMVHLAVELSDACLPVLHAGEADKVALRNLVAQLLAAKVPLHPLIDEG